MTIAMWSLVLNIVIAVLVVGYGIWLRNIMSQQLRSKNTTIETLETTIKTKDAQISALQADTAPAIAAAYNTLRTYANDITQQLQQQTDQLEWLSKEFVTVVDVHENVVTQSAEQQKQREEISLLHRLMGYCEGIAFSIRAMGAHLKDEFPPGPHTTKLDADTFGQIVVNAFSHTVQELHQEFSYKSLKADKVLTDLNKE